MPRAHSLRAIPIVRPALSSRACLTAVDAPAQVFPRAVRRPLVSYSLLLPRLLALVPGAPRGLGWANLAEGRLRLDRLPATAAGRLSSPAGPPRAGRGDPGRRHSSRKTRKSPACRPPLRSGPAAAPRVRFDRPRPVDRHRGRDGRGPTRNRRRTWQPSAASRSPRTATMPAR